jgi:hypothetical protein
MALDGIPGVTPRFSAFVQEVRLFIRDFPELNRLVRGEESSDRMVAWAVLDAVDDFNGTPHFTSLKLEDLLGMHQGHLMKRLTIIALLESIGLLQTRNHLNYSDGGLNVGVNDKTPMILNWLQYFQGSAEQMKQRVKVAINIQGILGMPGVSSELLAINSCYALY